LPFFFGDCPLRTGGVLAPARVARLTPERAGAFHGSVASTVDPMAKAFQRAGYVNFEREINMTWS
jgi:hypothetical protein